MRMTIDPELGGNSLWPRVIWLDQQIRAGAYPSVQAIQARCGVSRRTAINTVNHLRDKCGAPVVYNRARRGYEYSDPTYALPSVILREGELLAILLAQQVSRQYLGTRLEQPLREAVAKICSYLPDDVRLHPDEIEQVFHFAGGSSLDVPFSLMDCARRAIRERRVLRIEYYTASRDEVTERDVDPHFLTNVRGDWMLVAWDRDREAVRVFMLARVRWYDLLDERFERRPELTPQRYTEHVFQTEHGGERHAVAIRFDAYQARWIRERKWHASQRLEEQPDGGLVLHMDVCGEGDLLRWVLGYAGHAEVLAPDWLRRRAAEAARAVAARYADVPPGEPDHGRSE